ncbi:hypothetical protein PSTT_08992 [Puccinia striiformis]|uniref:Large ribosomal subunit protein uL6 alpha-beta domain-containing protein n=1 Tax=Puccinia striiformis TaxID=27350 RepID=A0A2S4VAC1_9BASI|nr:hypothetical protein PSTT_08992 [Puccinia striiformis]
MFGIGPAPRGTPSPALTSHPGLDNTGDNDEYRSRRQLPATHHFGSTMKDIYKDEELAVPEGVKITIRARTVTVEGPKGTLCKHVKHINMDLKLISTPKGQLVKFIVWHGGRKHIACLRTVKSLVENLTLTTSTLLLPRLGSDDHRCDQGFLYKMRSVYAHFPINIIISDDARSIEIRNFLGEKRVRHVPMLEGVTVVESKAQKDEITIQGLDIEKVSQSAASIHTSCLVKNKDIRKFLDGVYVSERTTIEKDE